MSTEAAPTLPKTAFILDCCEPDGRTALDGLLNHLLNGVLYGRMEYRGGQPHDFHLIYTNTAFHRVTGLPDVTGRLISEVIPGIRASDPQVFEILGRVATEGSPETFVMHLKALNEWFSVSAYCPQAGSLRGLLRRHHRTQERRDSP